MVDRLDALDLLLNAGWDMPWSQLPDDVKASVALGQPPRKRPVMTRKEACAYARSQKPSRRDIIAARAAELRERMSAIPRPGRKPKPITPDPRGKNVFRDLKRRLRLR